MIRRFAFLFLLLGLAALAFEQANPLLLYPYDSTEENPPAAVTSAGITAYDLNGPEGRVVVWAAAPRNGKPTVLYLHGNAGNLADRAGRFQRFRQSGFGVMAVAYPGSSGSEGRGSEDSLIATARLAFDSLHEETRFNALAGPLVIYGESLGAAVALGLVEDLALRPSEHQRPRGVVLEAPFASVQEMAEATVGGLSFLAPIFMDSWPSAQRAARYLDLPLVVIHGKQDRVVPIQQGQAVFDAAKSQQKKIYRVGSANHVNLWSTGILTQVFGHMALKDLGL